MSAPRRPWLWILLAAFSACAHTSQPPSGGKDEKAASGSSPPSSAPGGPPLNMSPGAILKPGAAEKIDEALRKRGFAAPADDKNLGAGSEKQLRLFQKSEGLAETGLPNRETVQRLGLDPDSIFKSHKD
jgi:Putative peptidoglycan binding domain